MKICPLWKVKNRNIWGEFQPISLSLKRFWWNMNPAFRLHFGIEELLKIFSWPFSQWFSIFSFWYWIRGDIAFGSLNESGSLRWICISWSGTGREFGKDRNVKLSLYFKCTWILSQQWKKTSIRFIGFLCLHFSWTDIHFKPIWQVRLCKKCENGNTFLPYWSKEWEMLGEIAMPRNRL